MAQRDSVSRCIKIASRSIMELVVEKWPISPRPRLLSDMDKVWDGGETIRDALI